METDFTGRGEALRGAGREASRRTTHPALTDSLTGLPNRLHFDTVFEVLFEMGHRGIPLTLIQFQIEGLDTYEVERGKAEADEAIRRFGTTLGESTRRMDLFARLEGGRFTALLQDCNLQGGLVAAERLSDLVADWAADTGLRFSAGVAGWAPYMEVPRQLWDRSERTLDEALQDGGGRITVAPPH